MHRILSTISVKHFVLDYLTKIFELKCTCRTRWEALLGLFTFDIDERRLLGNLGCVSVQIVLVTVVGQCYGIERRSRQLLL